MGTRSRSGDPKCKVCTPQLAIENRQVSTERSEAPGAQNPFKLGGDIARDPVHISKQLKATVRVDNSLGTPVQFVGNPPQVAVVFQPLHELAGPLEGEPQAVGKLRHSQARSGKIRHDLGRRWAQIMPSTQKSRPESKADGRGNPDEMATELHRLAGIGTGFRHAIIIY